MIEQIIETDGNNTPLFVKGLTSGFKKNQPSIKIGAARGTHENPQIVQQGDQLGTLKFNAYTGAAGEPYGNAAFISAIASETPSFGQKTIDAELLLGSINSVATGDFVTINSKGIIKPKGIIIEHTLNSVAQRDKSKPWWLSGGTDFSYPVPITINTTSTGILIAQTGNFKQPAMRFESYDNNPLKAGWTTFNRFRGTPDNPESLKNGDFIYAFDWMGKSSDEPWEWGMAQTAIIDDDPGEGYLPTSMNWVTRLEPFGEPKVAVKISSNGTLTTNYGSVINENLELNVEEVKNVNLEDVKFVKVKVNGEYRAMPTYSFG